MSEQEYCYRYEDMRYAAPLNEYDEPCGEGRKEIILRSYRVIKHTPKGFWLSFYGNGTEKKFVNICANKRYACLTKEDAMASYLARKKRQVRILSSQLKDAELFLQMASQGDFKEPIWMEWGESDIS